jgi:hypothetical protein
MSPIYHYKFLKEIRKISIKDLLMNGLTRAGSEYRCQEMKNKISQLDQKSKPLTKPISFLGLIIRSHIMD